MTNWPERVLWCWRCFKFTKHTGRSSTLSVEDAVAPVTAQINVTGIICRDCFNCKKIETELDHMEMS